MAAGRSVHAEVGGVNFADAKPRGKCQFRSFIMAMAIAALIAAIGAIVILLIGRRGQMGRVSVECPNCKSVEIARDSASPWIVLGVVLLFPFGLLLILLNNNVWCKDCRIRFK